MARARLTKATQRRAAKDEKTAVARNGTRDSYQNFALKLGVGTDNALSGSTYGFNPVTRNKIMLEWMYRGSWLASVAIDVPAEDMTRAGIEILSDNEPDEIEDIQLALVQTGTWTGVCDALKWGGLYGGAIGVIMVDGQDMATPLRVDTVGENQFAGVVALDRWTISPDLSRLVKRPGPNLGCPEFYDVVADYPGLSGKKIHHSRTFRILGIKMPFWQAVTENLWGISVLERLYDRMVAFDSATQGAAQLAYKSYIRTYAVDGMRSAIAAGGVAEENLIRAVQMMAKFQGVEGVTLIDAKDTFVGNQATSFTGMSDLLIQFGQQISGALQIPLVRLFGQSPVGLNSSGESDLRTYYDGIKQRQERDLRIPMTSIIQLAARSRGVKLPPEFGFNFHSLWQLTEQQKSEVSERDTRTVLSAEERGVVSEKTVLQELQSQSKVTGRWTNITDEMIENASEELPPRPDLGEEGPETVGGGGGGSSGGLEPREPKDAKDARRTRDQLPVSEMHGLPIVVEARAGERRPGGGPPQPADYGYVRRVGSTEGSQEWMDCFVGPHRDSRDVWVVDAFDSDNKFHEHKLMLGFLTATEARDCFDRAYGDGRFLRVGGLTSTSFDELSFREWLASGDFSRPLSDTRPRLVA